MSSPTLSRRWSIAWAIMFVLNVHVSMVLGWTCTTSLGRVGMIAAVALLYGFGVLLLRRAFVFGKGLVLGSVIPFFLQCCFLPVISAGLSLDLWRAISGQQIDIDTGPYLGFIGAFFVTLVTALPFILMALFLGSLITTAYEEVEDDQPASVT